LHHLQTALGVAAEQGRSREGAAPALAALGVRGAALEAAGWLRAARSLLVSETLLSPS